MTLTEILTDIKTRNGAAAKFYTLAEFHNWAVSQVGDSYATLAELAVLIDDRAHGFDVAKNYLADGLISVEKLNDDERSLIAPTVQIFTLFGEKVIAVHRTDPRTPVTELNIIESYFVDRSRGEIDEDKVREICELFNDSRNEIETVRVVGDRTMYRITDQRVLAVTEAITECHFCDNPADGSKRSFGFPHCGCQTVECDHSDDRICDALGHAN